MSATKRRGRRQTAWCYIRRVTTTQSSFITCTGFIRTVSEGSRDADRSTAGEARLRFILLGGAPGPLSRARRPRLGAAWPRSSPRPLIALAIVLFLLSGVAVFCGGNLSPGEREDRANCWVIVPLALIGLLDAYLYHSLARRRSLRRPWGAADLASLCARPSVQRVGHHPALSSKHRAPRTSASARAAMTRRVSEASRDKTSFHERNQVAPSDAGQAASEKKRRLHAAPSASDTTIRPRIDQSL
jgi:hypothetical protein